MIAGIQDEAIVDITRSMPHVAKTIVLGFHVGCIVSTPWPPSARVERRISSNIGMFASSERNHNFCLVMPEFKYLVMTGPSKKYIHLYADT